MNIRYKILAILFMITSISCDMPTNKVDSLTNKISKVTVALSNYGCEGDCPAKAISFDSKLQCSFYGGYNSEKKGYYSGKITHETWNNIESKCMKLITKGLDTTINQKTDHPYAEIYIKSADSVYLFKKNTGYMSDNDLEVLYWLIELGSKSNSMIACDSIYFETTVQFPIPVK